MSTTKRISSGNYTIDTQNNGENPLGNLIVETHTLKVQGDTIITGNLQVTGNTITVDSEVVTVNDKNLLLGNNQSTSANIDGAGILLGNIGGVGIVTWLYDDPSVSWVANVNIRAPGYFYSNGAIVDGSGAQGPQGVSGPQGEQGPQGPSGPGGSSFIINAADDNTTSPLYPVMVGAAGSDQTANISTSKFEFDASSGNLTVAGNLLTTGIDGNISGVVYYLGGNVAVNGNVQGNAIVGNAFTWANGVSIITSGPQGVSGPQGPQGVSGPQGPQGVSGPQGPQGVSGPQGPQGAASTVSGPQGPQGPQGASGPTGAGGASNLINATDNTSTTSLYPVMVGAAGSDQTANVTTSKFEFNASSGNLTLSGNILTSDGDGNISGVVYYLGGNVAVTSNVQGNAIVGNAFTWANGVSIITSGAQGPQGPQGPQGTAGAQGPQGPQGTAGAQGPQGPQGAASSVSGPQGPQGTAGAQGPQGPQGAASSVSGPQGPQGPTGPTSYPGAGIAVSTGSSWGTSKNTPTGDVVGTSDIQTITNKTFTGYTETIYALSGTTPAFSANNGTIQIWTLTGASTPTDSINDGQSVLLMIDDGSAYTITWPSVIWKTDAGVAPTLNTSGNTAVVLWKVGGNLYGARVGDA